MGITSIFYTENCQVVYSVSSVPNNRGIVETVYELNPKIIPCSIAPISNHKARERWGIHTNATCEISFDLDGTINPQDVYGIMFEDVLYIVENYEVYPAFMILDKSVTFAVRSDK